MRCVVAAGLVAAAVASVACGGESTTVEHRTAPGSSKEWEAVCNAVPEAFCGKFEECAPLLAQLYYIAPDCRSLYGQICRDVARLSDTALTPTEYHACFTAIAAAECDPWLYEGAMPEACNLVGRRQPGEPCGNDLQCSTGNCTATFETCGICKRVAGEGEDCGLDECDFGLDCSDEQRCTQRNHLGDPCEPVAGCSSGMVCDTLTCQRPPGEGEYCMVGGRNCDVARAVLCNPTTDRCEPLAVAREGEPCSGFCVAGTFCDAGTTPATCVAVQKEGQPCTSSFDQCDTTLTCKNGVCVRLDPATCN
jgi:hypothetical protein